MCFTLTWMPDLQNAAGVSSDILATVYAREGNIGQGGATGLAAVGLVKQTGDRRKGGAGAGAEESDLKRCHRCRGEDGNLETQIDGGEILKDGALEADDQVAPL